MTRAAVDSRLYEWCTERQREILLAVEAAGTLRGAARQLGVNYSSVRGALSQVEKKAALSGYSPRYDLTRAVAPGFVAKGHSTLYRRGEPEPVIQWVKSKADDAAREQIIRESVAALMEDVPRRTPVPAPALGHRELCNVYTLTDCHVGMHAWGKQTGADWDLQIAEATLVGAFEHMIEASPAAETCVVAQLGDYLHFDGLVAETPAHRHPLDADSRYSKVVRVAVRVLRAIVDRALLRHQRVLLLVAEGNHDLAGSVWLRQMFALLFEQEPRVQVVDSELPYYVYQHGSTMLGWHHGHLTKRDNLPGMFAAHFAPTWGQTAKRYIHCGHQHHVHEREHGGAKVIQHPTLSARDAYAARGGWISERQVTAITYHSEYGEVARNTVCPEMLEVA